MGLLRRANCPGSNAPKQHKNDNYDQDDAEDADTTVSVAVAVATKAPTKATEQGDDKDDDKNNSKGHGFISCNRDLTSTLSFFVALTSYCLHSQISYAATR